MINPIEIRCTFDISEDNMPYIKIEYYSNGEFMNVDGGRKTLNKLLLLNDYIRFNLPKVINPKYYYLVYNADSLKTEYLEDKDLPNSILLGIVLNPTKKIGENFDYKNSIIISFFHQIYDLSKKADMKKRSKITYYIKDKQITDIDTGFEMHQREKQNGKVFNFLSFQNKVNEIFKDKISQKKM